MSLPPGLPVLVGAGAACARHRRGSPPPPLPVPRQELARSSLAGHGGSPRGARRAVMEVARAELAQRSWRWSARSSPAVMAWAELVGRPWRRIVQSSQTDHGAREELALHQPSPRLCGSQLLCISVLLGLSP
jgi:hypothetical protein